MHQPQHRQSKKEIKLKNERIRRTKKLLPPPPPGTVPLPPPPGTLSPPATPKVDAGAPVSIHHVGSMFQPVTDLLSWRDTVVPATSYPALYDKWQQDTEADINTVTSESSNLSGKESESFDVGKEVAFAVLQKFLGKAKVVGWSKRTVDERLSHIDAIMARPQVPQRTPAWFAQGKEVLTASEFATIFGSPRAVGQLVMHKVPIAAEEAPPTSNRLACLSCEMTSLDWGVRFEPVVKQILNNRWGATIQDTGRLMHPTDTHLAASPDGIIMTATDPARIGRLVEIKCPIRRAVGEGVPFEYWCQMQIQMEVTGIDECEYVEVKLQSLEKGVTDLSGVEPHGYVWLLQNPTTFEMRYAYTVQERAELEATSWDTVEKIPWLIDDFYAVTVVRDRAWFESTSPSRVAFWEKVYAARKGEFQCPESSRKKPMSPKLVVNVCKIEDD